MSDKLNTLEALRLASLKAKGYTAEQIAELSSAMEDIINDINDSLKTCEAHVQSAHAPANAEENVIVSIQRNGQAITPDNKVVNIEVPTKTSALENDSGYATTEDVEDIHTLRDVENYIDTQPEATPQEVAGQCWRNSKYDPPTEADADRLGRIIVWGAAVKHVDITYWENAIFHPVDVPFWMPLPVAPEEKAE